MLDDDFELEKLPQAELVARARALRIVLQVTRDVALGGSIEALASRFVDAVATYTRFASVVVMRHVPEKDGFEIVARRGFDESNFPSQEFRFLPAKGSLSGLAAEQGRMLTTEDIANDDRVDPRVRKALAANEYTSGACVPLIYSEKLLGTFNLVYPRGNALQESERSMLTTLAASLAAAMAQHIFYEREKHLEEQLLQSQKMEAIGHLAGGVAHDFNNMLSIIIGQSEIALAAVDPAEPVHASLNAIKTAGERSAELTRQLLAYARKQTIAPRNLDLNETVEGMLKMLQRLIGEDIELSWMSGKALWPVRLDPSQVDQVLANLCVNARDAIEGVGKITIETDNTVLDESYCKTHEGFTPGEYVRLTVSDKGHGMDAETLKNIFEPFFTTKSKGKGTGLGLSTVYGIVKQNNGFISVDSEPDSGTAFNIYLPRHWNGESDEPEKIVNLPVQPGNETIMIVEDEQMILEMTKKILGELGYSIIAARTPSEAVKIAREYGEDIDLLLSDVIMPGMNGRDLAKNIMRFHPGIKHLFMSGYTANIISHHGVLEDGVYFIPKPFSVKALSAKIREVLGAEKR